MVDIKFSKIFKVVDIKENPIVDKIPDWVKELELKENDEIEVINNRSIFYPTEHNVKITNLETGKSISILSKAFTKSLAYGNVNIEEK